MAVLAIASLFVAIAIPVYSGFIDRARLAKAIGDIGSISVQIDRFSLNNNDRLPDALNELPMDIPLDPWGREYQYVNIRNAAPGFGGFRKDGKLKVLNTDFDLYSIGDDGASLGPLSAPVSRDDIVRANTGAFIGLGEDY